MSLWPSRSVSLADQPYLLSCSLYLLSTMGELP